MKTQKSYFSNLNYTLANEDTSVEVEILRRFQLSGNLSLRPNEKLNIFSICGSGSRALPLALVNENTRLTVLDTSQDQIDLAKMRLRAIQRFCLDDYKCLLGYPPFHGDVYIDRRIKLLELIDETHFVGQDIIIYMGRWEKVFAKIAKLTSLICGQKLKKVFEFKEIAEQKKWWNESYNKFWWNIALWIIGNKVFFDRLLYKGKFVKKNLPQSYFQFYHQSYSYLFENILARKNFFMQLSFLGKCEFSEVEVAEIKPQYYALMKKHFENNLVEVEFVKSDFIEFLDSRESRLDDSTKFHFISLSDVPSYFEGDVEKNFLQKLSLHLMTGALVVLRHYLRIPDANQENFTDVTNYYSDIINLDQVGMYKIQILKYNKSLI